jgi:hypothetical protein
MFSLYAFPFAHSKDVMNATMTLKPMVEYSTLFSLFFSTPFLLMFFLIIPLPLLAFVCVHSFALPFPYYLL